MLGTVTSMRAEYDPSAGSLSRVAVAWAGPGGRLSTTRFQVPLKSCSKPGSGTRIGGRIAGLDQARGASGETEIEIVFVVPPVDAVIDVAVIAMERAVAHQSRPPSQKRR